MKQKILYFSLDKRDTTSFWRMAVLKYIQNTEFELIDISENKVFDWTVFLGVSLFIIQRPFGREHAQVMTAAKNMNVTVLADYDDDLTCVDMFNPTYNLYKDNQETLKICLQLADELWVSTPSIKDSYEKYNKNIHIIPNSHNDFHFKVKDKLPFDPKGKKCYYRGGGSHQADVNSVANGLIKIINDNKDWTFTFMGDRFTFLELNTGDNYHIVPGITIFEYFKYIYNDNPQAFIFPLVDTKFNRGKSNISWLEASFVGSAFFGNTKLPEFNGNEKGLIYDISLLNELINNQESSLQSANNRSWEYITDTLLLSNINKLREQRLLANL